MINQDQVVEPAVIETPVEVVPENPIFNFNPEKKDVVEPVVIETTQAPVEPVTPAAEVVPETVIEEPATAVEQQPIDVNQAWEIIKKEKGLEVDNIDELLKPREEKAFSPQMEKFDEFIKKTGNDNYNDFLETQKDWSTVPAEEKVKNWLRLSNPALSNEEVQFLYEDEYAITDLDPEYDSREITKRNIKLKTDSEKAEEFFNKRKEEFSVVGGSDKHIPDEYKKAKEFQEGFSKHQDEYQKELERVGNSNKAKAESIFNNEFKGFEFSVKNEEDAVDKILYKPEDLEQAKAFHSNLSNLNDLLFKDGEIKNPQDFFIISEIARIGASKFVEQIANTSTALLIERQDKKSKNIVDNTTSSPTVIAQGTTIKWGNQS